MPKTAVPGVGYLAYFADSEGNVPGIMQDDGRGQLGPTSE